MPINYALFENPLTPDPEDYTARVEITGSIDKEALLERMIEQGSTVTSGDILAVIEDLTKAVEALLLLGFRVNVGDLVQFYPRIRGTFHGPKDTFDHERHTLDAAAAIGPRIRNTIRDHGKTHKNPTHLPAPDITNYKDLVTGQTNHAIHPNGLGTLNGHHLKYNEAQPDEGIYLINTATQTETKVIYVQQNQPAQLVFINPDTLTPGQTYQIQVRARMRDSAHLRTGRLDQPLTAT